MHDESFNPATYEVRDIITGEIIPVQIFIEEVNKDYWEKAFAKTIAEYIGLGGSSACKVLAYLIKNKTIQNLVNGTVRSISEEVGVSTRATISTFKLLQEKGFIKKIRNGCYFVYPKLMSYGSKQQGAILMKLWGEIK